MKLPSSGRVFLRWLKRRLPVTLFGRSLLIIVLPVAIMQIAVTYVFFDAHWQTVTARLSEGLAGDIAWAVESYQEDPRPESFAKLSRRAEDSMSLSIALQPDRRLPLRRRDPPPLIEPFFAPIDRSLERALSDRLDLPFWFDTTRYPAYVDIRVSVPGGVMRVLAPRERAFATQGHIFVLWMTLATVAFASTLRWITRWSKNFIVALMWIRGSLAFRLPVFFFLFPTDGAASTIQLGGSSPLPGSPVGSSAQLSEVCHVLLVAFGLNGGVVGEYA